MAGANLTGLALKMALAHPRYHSILGANQVGADAYPERARDERDVDRARRRAGGSGAAAGRRRLGAAAYVIAVSTSLMVLGWHFPSDVLGGLLIASGFFFLAVAALRVGAAGRAGAAAQRVRLALSPRLGGAAVAVLAGWA